MVTASDLRDKVAVPAALARLADDIGNAMRRMPDGTLKPAAAQVGVAIGELTAHYSSLIAAGRLFEVTTARASPSAQADIDYKRTTRAWNSANVADLLASFQSMQTAAKGQIAGSNTEMQQEGRNVLRSIKNFNVLIILVNGIGISRVVELLSHINEEINANDYVVNPDWLAAKNKEGIQKWILSDKPVRKPLGMHVAALQVVTGVSLPTCLNLQNYIGTSVFFYNLDVVQNWMRRNTATLALEAITKGGMSFVMADTYKNELAAYKADDGMTAERAYLMGGFVDLVIRALDPAVVDRLHDGLGRLKRAKVATLLASMGAVWPANARTDDERQLIVNAWEKQIIEFLIGSNPATLGLWFEYITINEDAASDTERRMIKNAIRYASELVARKRHEYPAIEQVDHESAAWAQINLPPTPAEDMRPLTGQSYLPLSDMTAYFAMARDVLDAAAGEWPRHAVRRAWREFCNLALIRWFGWRSRGSRVNEADAGLLFTGKSPTGEASQADVDSPLARRFAHWTHQWWMEA